jgi:fatty-acyl-CoA synthase
MPRREGVRTDVGPESASSNESGLGRGRGKELVDCGRVFPGHELAIVDESGQRLGDRQVGQIVARGPSITKGYFQEPELTAQTFRTLPGDAPGEPPWLFTGDLGYRVGDRLFVCGRVKDIIIVRGRNYYPSDIEWAVSELPGVRRGNVVAFGVEVDGGEQLVVACEGAASDAAAIREATATCVAEQFGLTVHETVVVPLASLPRTSSGKPQRRRTRQMYVEGTLPRARSVQAAEDAAQGGA